MAAMTKEYLKKHTDPAVVNGINRLCDIIAKKSSTDGDVISAFKFLLEIRGERDVTPAIDEIPTATPPPPVKHHEPSEVKVKM